MSDVATKQQAARLETGGIAQAKPPCRQRQVPPTVRGLHYRSAIVFHHVCHLFCAFQVKC